FRDARPFQSLATGVKNLEAEENFCYVDARGVDVPLTYLVDMVRQSRLCELIGNSERHENFSGEGEQDDLRRNIEIISRLEHERNVGEDTIVLRLLDADIFD